MIVKIIVTGKVQGVFFRANAKTVAENLRLNGTAKNIDDGSIEIFVQGEKEQIQQMIYFCQKGTMTSKIEKVQVQEIKDHIGFIDFKII